MKNKKFCGFLAFLLCIAVYAGAQELNSVPLDHEAYNLISTGVIRGIIAPPSAVKPWPVQTVKAKLRELLDNPARNLSAKEEDIIIRAIDSFQEGKYRKEGDNFTIEGGFGWESRFSVSSDKSFSTLNMVKGYVAGDVTRYASWNITALGELLYINREKQDASSHPVYVVSSAFPYAFTKLWDGGVLSLRNPGIYASWPDDPALAYTVEGELNGVFFDRRLHLRTGRVRRDWGAGFNGTSLFISQFARPFTAFEGTVSPLPWLNISLLEGALEYYQEDNRQADKPFASVLSAAQVEFNPSGYIHFGIGGAAVLAGKPNPALFSNLELRLPGLFVLWGSLFVDHFDASAGNFFSANSNSYAYQLGVRAIVRWLPFASVTLRYSKVEPYCYSGEPLPPASAYVNGGESLGYYLPPNSDELLLRFDTMPRPAVSVFAQYQMTRHGVEYGYGAAGGSSQRSMLDTAASSKYFLMDGVYQWNDVIKAGGSCKFNAGKVPVSVYAEAGVVMTRYTVNGSRQYLDGRSGVGTEADYEPVNDEVYRSGNRFIFSIGFKLFS